MTVVLYDWLYCLWRHLLVCVSILHDVHILIITKWFMTPFSDCTLIIKWCITVGSKNLKVAERKWNWEVIQMAKKYGKNNPAMRAAAELRWGACFPFWHQEKRKMGLWAMFFFLFIKICFFWCCIKNILWLLGLLFKRSFQKCFWQIVTWRSLFHRKQPALEGLLIHLFITYEQVKHICVQVCTQKFKPHRYCKSVPPQISCAFITASW